MDVVDTEKEDTIRDDINMSGKTTLTDPMIIDLAETADETNLEVSKVEAAPRRKTSTKGNSRRAPKLLFSGGKLKRLA